MSPSRAHAIATPVDDEAARELLTKAHDHLTDAERDTNNVSSRQLLSYQAALDAMNALLKAAGRRITSGAGGHMARIEECERLIPDEAELLERVDDARQLRNRAAYDGFDAAEDIVEEQNNDVRELITAVRSTIDAWALEAESGEDDVRH